MTAPWGHHSLSTCVQMKFVGIHVIVGVVLASRDQVAKDQ
jgi:hypothetical protein